MHHENPPSLSARPMVACHSKNDAQMCGSFYFYTMAKITVQNTQITVIRQNEDDYISLTDMLKAKDGEFFFSNWLRNRNTIEFLGIWERLMNPNFNCAEFDIIKSQAGLNRFRLSAKEWTEKTNANSINMQENNRQHLSSTLCNILH